MFLNVSAPAPQSVSQTNSQGKKKKGRSSSKRTGSQFFRIMRQPPQGEKERRYDSTPGPFLNEHEINATVHDYRAFVFLDHIWQYTQ
jgi:hypothetical protein